MKAKLSLSLSMAIFGTIAVLVRNVQASSATIALMRAAIALVCLALLQAALGKPLRLKNIGRDVLPLFLSGAAMGFNWILLFEAYKYTTVSVATLSYYFAPVIVTIASSVLFRERLSIRQIVCFLGSTAGLILVIGLNNLRGGSAKGVLFALSAATLYATVVLLNKRIRSVSGVDRTLLQFIASVIVLTPYLLITEGVHLENMTPGGWGSLLLLGVVHTGVAYVLYFSALKDLRGQEVAILSYIDPLVAVLLSFTLLHEPTATLQLTGGGLILGFTLLNEISPKSVIPRKPTKRSD